jgi:beta-glucosidase
MDNTPAWDEMLDVDARVDVLIAKLTRDQKIDLVSGVAGVIHPDLGELTIADGPAGVRRATMQAVLGQATQLPAPIAVAATWDEDMARQHGDVIGAEAAATGIRLMLAPAVDINRTPLSGRSFESFGEDPLLQARMAAGVIHGIQSHRVMACVKHYLVNNQEYQRNFIDVRVDERALQEIYLPPYAAAVQAGKVASVLGSYNKINGEWACGNRHTLTEVLRDQFGFRGFTVTDFMAQHETAESPSAGLDRELGPREWGDKLREAVKAGAVTEAQLDAMLRRQLRPQVAMGQIDHPFDQHPLPIETHGQIAREIAERSLVLLKNSGVLPLQDDRVTSIAVIGSDADNISASCGGSAHVEPTYAVSVLDGLRKRAGVNVRVVYAQGVEPVTAGALVPGPAAVPTALFSVDGADGEHGLRATYWSNPNFEGEPALTRIDAVVELNQILFDSPALSASSPKRPPLTPNLGPRFSARWAGIFTAPASGDYTLSLSALGSARLWLDGTGLSLPKGELRIALDGTASASDVAQVQAITLNLVEGRRYDVKIEYAADAPAISFLYGAQMRFGWQPPADVLPPLMQAAVDLALQSDVAIVVARTCELEGMDRPSLQLPNDQARLIRAVAAANPRTIVVLMSGSAVETASWDGDVPAVLAAWFTGQEQGNAVARVLWGDVDAQGRLPVTFPMRDDQTALTTREQYPGMGGVVHYSEGIFVGYRGYDQLGIAPRFPFGHGLSFTQFEYGHLQITPEKSDGRSEVTISFDVTNVGERAGVEVAQVYLGLPADAHEPPRRLAGWVRVALQAGERKRADVILQPSSFERPFEIWDVSHNDWRVVAGDVRVDVGASSRDIRLAGTVQVKRDA